MSAVARASVPASSLDISKFTSKHKERVETVHEKFRRITGIDDDGMIDEFLSLTFINTKSEKDKPIFRLSSKAIYRDVLFQVACCIRTRGPDPVLNFLKTGHSDGSGNPIRWADPKTLVLNLPTVNTKKREDDIREKTLKNAQIFRYKVRALKGPKCHKCSSTNTTMSEAQTCSADEGKTVFVTCVDCGFGWRAR